MTTRTVLPILAAGVIAVLTACSVSKVGAAVPSADPATTSTAPESTTRRPSRRPPGELQVTVNPSIDHDEAVFVGPA